MYIPEYENYIRQNMTVDPYAEMIERMYPDIYKMVYPMVRKAVETNTMPVTEELIENMARSIHSSIEADENAEVAARDGIGQGETKRFRPNNFLMGDLVRILLLRELLGNRRPQYRPPHYGPRPPHLRSIYDPYF